MATLITHQPKAVSESFNEEVCKSSYPDFQENRKTVIFGSAEKAVFQGQKDNFYTKVITPLFQSADKIKIAQYFVFKISDLKALFEMSPEADYLHLHNTLDDNNANNLYAIPANSESETAQKEIISETSLMVVAFPCPPDPRCPKYTLA